jgi:A/G-specific adenine glycosylase
MKPDEIKQFRHLLLEWFDKNKRVLPWRINPNWYKTYLSEIILQQTTIEQGLPYFLKILRKYPDISQLAKADEQEMLHQWAGLGYYSRAVNMLKAAQIIVKEYKCIFPDNYKQAVKLPGIGPYSGSAILSIARNKPLSVTDGNVIRVIARLLAIRKDTRNSKTIKLIKQWADSLLDREQPGKFNEALMELGALLCTPQKPQCNSCPVSTFCRSYLKKLTTRIPFRSAPAAKHKKFQIAAILEFNSKICLVRRPARGLLAGMWELPAMEISGFDFQNPDIKIFMKKHQIRGNIKTFSGEMTHLYSHIHLSYKAVIIQVNHADLQLDNYTDMIWISKDETDKYPVHNSHKKILKWYNEIFKN